MADEVDQQVAKAILAGQGSKRGGMLWAIIAVAAIGVAAGAGLGVGRFARPAQAGPASEESPDPKEESASSHSSKPSHSSNPASPGGQYVYYEFAQITVNLDEPRLSRHITVALSLAMSKDQTALIEQRLPELKNWLTVYLTGLTLDDLRGPKNLNRIRREVQDNFNHILWPEGKGFIEQVFFKEFHVS